MKEERFEERVNELKEKYEGANDFDIRIIVKLEMEYEKLSDKNPEHTKRRREILDMRQRLLRDLKPKPRKIKKPMYIEVEREKCILYYNGKTSYIRFSNNITYVNVVDMICNCLDVDEFDIYIDTMGIGMGLFHEFNDKNIKCNEIKRTLLEL